MIFRRFMINITLGIFLFSVEARFNLHPMSFILKSPSFAKSLRAFFPFLSFTFFRIKYSQ